MKEVTNSTSKTRPNKLIWIIAPVVFVLCAALACCLLIIAGYFLLQPAWINKTTVPEPQTLPLVPTSAELPSLPTESPLPEVSAGLDFTADPLFGSASLQRGFSPDPYFVDAGAGGTVDTAAFDLSCGFTTPAPTFTFRLSGGADATFLRIFFTANDGSDTTLIVYTPDQEWKCADDSSYGGMVDPVLDFDLAPSGKYVLWVGTKQSDTYASGKIYITQSETIAP